MVEFLHILEVLFGVAAIGCAIGAVINMHIAIIFPKSMKNAAWSYAKKAYIFLGLMILFIVIGVLLSKI